MVAGLGDTSMAAVNVANQINLVFFVAINAICGAGGIYLAQFKGADDAGGMRHAYRFKGIFALCLAAVFFILYRTISSHLIAMMTMGNAAQDEIVAIGSDYLRLSSFTLIPMAISMPIGTSFREIGRPRIPLFFSAAATAVNTIGNWLLIYGNLGAPRLEVFGAATATIIARLFETGLFLWYVRKDRSPFFAGFPSLFRVDKKLIRTILSKSVMIFLSEASWIGSETIMTALYNGRGGAEVVAGMAAGFTVANIFFLLFGGIWTTAAVVVGGSLGAGRLEEGRTRAEWLKSGSVAVGIFTALIGAGLSTLLIPLVFTNLTASARHISLSLVYIILIYLPLWCLLNAQFAISRAGGDAAMGMYADVSVNSLLFVPGAFILALRTSLDPVVMFAILKTTDVAKYLVARYFYKKERWVRNLTLPPKQ
jgi:Na+-driven multidrug efflux pump